MDTSLEDIYSKHPTLRPDDSDGEELRNTKSYYVMLYSMTPEERREHDQEQARRERQQVVESLIEEYHINQSIKDSAHKFATNMGRKARIAIEEEDRDEAEKYIGYIRTAKETIQLVDEDQIRIRSEIKEIRRNGTWHEKLQAKYQAIQQKKS